MSLRMTLFDENANSVWWFYGDPMSLNGDVQKIRAKQVGVLMRHYRSSFRAEDGRTGLTMEDVLERMAKVNQRYESSAPSTVSRWESGETMPRKRRLQEFGTALNLLQHEIDGLAALAGIDAESRLDPARAAVSAVGRHQDVAASATGSGRLIPQIGGVFGQRSIRSLLVQALQGSIFQFLLPVLAIAGAGYLLSSLGITETWILMLYIGIAMGLVVFQGLLRMRRADSLRDLLFMSLFVVLSAPLTQIPFVHTDHYGLYLLSGPNDSAKLILLSLAACLSMALIASLAFDLLWRWQYSGRGATKAHHRAVWVVAPPVAFVYLCILLLGTLGAWIEYLFVLSVLTGVFITLALLRDQTITLSIWDRRFLLWSAFMTSLSSDRYRGRGGAGGLLGIQCAVRQRSHADTLLGRGLQHVGVLSARVGGSQPGQFPLECHVGPGLHGHCRRWHLYGDHLSAGNHRDRAPHCGHRGTPGKSNDASHSAEGEDQISLRTWKACRQPDLFKSGLIGGVAAQPP